MFQSCDPEKWISAAESSMYWLNADYWNFFGVGETERGSVHGEGEEDQQRDDDEQSIDPQDRRSGGWD